MFHFGLAGIYIIKPKNLWFESQLKMMAFQGKLWLASLVFAAFLWPCILCKEVKSPLAKTKRLMSPLGSSLMPSTRKYLYLQENHIEREEKPEKPPKISQKMARRLWKLIVEMRKLALDLEALQKQTKLNLIRYLM